MEFTLALLSFGGDQHVSLAKAASEYLEEESDHEGAGADAAERRPGDEGEPSAPPREDAAHVPVRDGNKEIAEMRKRCKTSRSTSARASLVWMACRSSCASSLVYSEPKNV